MAISRYRIPAAFHIAGSFAMLLAATLLPLAGCSKSDDAAATADAAAAAETGPDDAQTRRAEAIAKAVAEGKTVVTPEQTVVAADTLIKQGRNVAANKLLTAALTVDPTLAEAHMLKATIYMGSNLPSRAIASISKAIELKPDSAAYRTIRGRYLLGQQAYQQALADFDAALASDASYAPAHNHRGLVNVAVSRHEDALADFNAAIASKPDFAEAFANRGYVQLRLDKQSAALADFDKAIEINPNYVDAYNNRGMALMTMDRAADAVADFTRAIELAPGRVASYIRRAKAYEASGDASAAQADRDEVVWLRQLAALTQRIRRDPAVVKHYLDRSKLLHRHGNTADAVADLDRALAQNAESTEAMVAKARLLAEIDRGDEAIALCDQALGLESNPVAYSVRGDVLYGRGEFARAISDYESAQRLDSQVAKAYYEHSKQLQQSGQIQQASAAFETARQIDPTIETR